MTTVWLALLALLCLESQAGPWQEESSPKIRITQFKEGATQSFRGNQSHSDHFKLLERDGDYLLVGARNLVYNISLRTLDVKKKLSWYSNEDDIRMCRLKGKSEEECHNYIRVLAKKSLDTILVCGTNAYKPMCREYKEMESNYTKLKEKAGVGLCPYDPNHNSTAIFADGDLYVATVAQFSGADPLIYRQPLRTDQLNLKYLNAPNFVSSLHSGEYVYFFFREIAVEYINCGKVVYSRVARVCIKDKGGPHKFKNQWTSFLKARLNCSISGEFPFYFNEIQSTSQIVDGVYGKDKAQAQLIYGIFNTPANSISGSAICAFSLEEILRTFEGPFKGQEDITSNWLPVQNSKVPEPRPGQCVNDSSTLPEMTVNFIKDHTLMDHAVPPYWSSPILLHTTSEYRYTYIAVDPQIETSGGDKYDVLFIGTDNGKVVKAVNTGSASSEGRVDTVVIEEMVVFPHQAPVTNLMVYNTLHQAKLVVVSNEEIKTIHLHNCSRHARSCSECVGLQDPYCAWDEDRLICTSSPSRLWNRKKFIQNIAEGWDERCKEGRPLSSGNAPAKPPLHPARQENHPGNNLVSNMETDGRDNGAIPGPSRGHHYVYTAETLAIAVTTSIVSSLVVGFISGYVFSRRCRTEEVDSPYDDAHYLDQHHGSARLGRDPAHMNHSEGFLPPSTNNKQINLVLNVPPKNGNGKSANSSADNKPLQKVKKIYL